MDSNRQPITNTLFNLMKYCIENNIFEQILNLMWIEVIW